VSEIKRKKNESFEAFIRRVKKRWQQSGKILQAKKIQFRIEKKSKNMGRASTLHRLKKAEKLEYLRKTGQLPEDKFYRR